MNKCLFATSTSSKILLPACGISQIFQTYKEFLAQMILYLLNKKCENMGGHISLKVVLNTIPVKEGVQNIDKVLWLLEIVLHSDKVVDASS